MVKIGKNIMDARKRLGMTQQELADLVGYKTKSAVNKIEMGIRDLPQSKIKQFAAALGTTPGQLLGWDADPDDLSALAARVLADPGLLKLVQDYTALSEADQYALQLMADSLAAKNKKD